MDKIAIIIPTIHRDDLLMETINSILENYCDNWTILISDQNNIENYSEEKRIFYETSCAKAHEVNPINNRIKVCHLPYNCGLSVARNELVKIANNLGIKYCLIGADSIKFNESMQNINILINYLNHDPDFNIDLIGLGLQERIGWEAWLDLKESFILDFIEKCPVNALLDRYLENSLTFWHCDIVRNFFLATTKSLLDVQWDNFLVMSEHEDFFWRYKQKDYKVACTDYCYGEYIGKKEGEYAKLRATNMALGKRRLLDKYQLKGWIKYINLENAKKGQL